MADKKIVNYNVKSGKGIRRDNNGKISFLDDTFEGITEQLNRNMQARSGYSFSNTTRFAICNDKEDPDSIMKISRRAIGIIATTTVAQLCMSIDRDDDLEGYIKPAFITLANIQGVTLYVGGNWNIDRPILIPRIVLKQQYKTRMVEILERIFGFNISDSELYAGVGKDYSYTIEEEEGEDAVYNLMDKHFQKIWNCSIDSVVSNLRLRGEFVRYFRALAPACKNLCRESARFETIELPHDVIRIQKKVLDYHTNSKIMEEINMEYGLIKRDREMYEKVWRSMIDNVLLTGTRPIIGDESLNTAEQLSLGIKILVDRAIPIKCFGSNAKDLKWDKGDIEKVNYNVQYLHENNVPCILEEYRSNMKKFRECLSKVKRAMGIIVDNDREDARMLTLATDDCKKVAEIAKELQVLLIGDSLTPNCKHVNERYSRAVIYVAENLYPMLSEGLYSVPSRNMVTDEEDKIGLHFSMYGLWHMIKECKKHGVDQRLIDVIEKFYMKGRKSGEFIIVDKVNSEIFDEILAEGYMRHIICDNSIKVVNGTVDLKFVVEDIILNRDADIELVRSYFDRVFSMSVVGSSSRAT